MFQKRREDWKNKLETRGHFKRDIQTHKHIKIRKQAAALVGRKKIEQRMMVGGKSGAPDNWDRETSSNEMITMKLSF